VITQGAIADLVIWSAPPDASSPDLRVCKPRFVMIDGQLIDLSQPERAKHGRFLGK
jgi:imidazolonepropionase-like amidohydrolase